MKRILIRAALVLGLVIFYFTSISIMSHSYIYTETIDQIAPKLKLWAKNADYRFNYLEATSEKTIDGKKSLKMDLTIYGDGGKECFYYWIIPLRVKHYGEIIHSVKLWAESNSAKYVTVGINFLYPPDSLKVKPVLKSGEWVKLTDSKSGEISMASLGGDITSLITSYKAGLELNRIGIFVRAKGEHRLIFYLSEIELRGRTFNLSDFQKLLKDKWKNYSEITGTQKTQTVPVNSFVKSPDIKMAVYSVPATKFNRLTGSNLPDDAKPLDKLSTRVCAGEFEDLSVIIQPKEKLRDVEVSWTKFRGEGRSLDASVLEASIAKVWFQAGVKSTEVNKKLLTQELLLKNDKLIKVDLNTQTNYLWVTDNKGNGKYVDISSPQAQFPQDVTVKDSKTLLPFDVEGGNNKQLLFTIHVPEDAKAGKYKSDVTIEDRNGVLSKFPVEIQVLPFRLDPSRLTYSLYYHGALRDWKLRPFHCEDKSPEQLLIELKDMKEHGVLYPNNYQDLKHLGENLELRNKAGLPNDRLYSTLLDWCTSLAKSSNELEAFKQRITKFKTEAEKHGCRELFIYGIDEARGQRLKDQRPMWTAAHEAGAKVFVAGYEDTFSDMGDLLDLGIIQGPLNKEQPALYHSAGHQVFSYSNPQVGQENPEIYRRNYGLELWKCGYDGEMNYAYQKNYGSIWNDFDNPRYREETFTYPTSDGIIPTIQWEGFRQGVNDVRFISTLLNMIDKMKSSGKDVSRLEKWVNSIDPASQDPDELREKIIDKILSINYL